MAGPLDDPPRDARVRCTFYTKTPAPDGSGFIYRMVSPGCAGNDGLLSTFHPPNIGDLIWLNDTRRTSTTGMWQVTGRDWLHNDYGSTNWPFGKQHPTVGPALTIIVEPAEGLFIDQVPDPEAPEEE